MKLTVRYTTPDIHCRHRRYECDGGIMQVSSAWKFQASTFSPSGLAVVLLLTYSIFLDLDILIQKARMRAKQTPSIQV